MSRFYDPLGAGSTIAFRAELFTEVQAAYGLGRSGAIPDGPGSIESPPRCFPRAPARPLAGGSDTGNRALHIDVARRRPAGRPVSAHFPCEASAGHRTWG